MRALRQFVCLLAGLAIPAAFAWSQDTPPPPQQRPFHHHPHGGTGFTGPRGFSGHFGGGWAARGATGVSGGMNPQMRGMGRGFRPGPGAFPPFFDELAKMPADERQKALEADPHFTRLPPNMQADVRARLERFSAMTPEQQQEMRDRFTIMSRLSPAHREQVREVFSRWQKLPADRRQAMRDEFRALASKTAADRDKRLSDPEFQRAYSAQEQQLLKDLSGLLREPGDRPADRFNRGARMGGRSN